MNPSNTTNIRLAADGYDQATTTKGRLSALCGLLWHAQRMLCNLFEEMNREARA